MSLEEELKQIDHEIKRLKVQYDLYFQGALARPPNDMRDSLGRQLRRYQGTEMRNLADRFLYNNVVNKYNTFVELWSKMMRAREEGTRVHPLAARAALRAAKKEAGGAGPPSAAPGAAPKTPSSKGHPSRPAGPPSEGAWRIHATSGGEESLRGLYDGYLAARRAAGDQRPLAYEAFSRQITQQMSVIRGKANCEAVEFRIYSQDKKVLLKARPAG